MVFIIKMYFTFVSSISQLSRSTWRILDIRISNYPDLKWSTLDHQQCKRPRQHRSSSPAARGHRSKLRGNHENTVVCGVEPHVARALWRLHVFDYMVLVRGVLVDHGERAVRIRGEHVSRCRVEPRAV